MVTDICVFVLVHALKMIHTTLEDGWLVGMKDLLSIWVVGRIARVAARKVGGPEVVSVMRDRRAIIIFIVKRVWDIIIVQNLDILAHSTRHGSINIPSCAASVSSPNS